MFMICSLSLSPSFSLSQPSSPLSQTFILTPALPSLSVSFSPLHLPLFPFSFSLLLLFFSQRWDKFGSTRRAFSKRRKAFFRIEFLASWYAASLQTKKLELEMRYLRLFQEWQNSWLARWISELRQIIHIPFDKYVISIIISLSINEYMLICTYIYVHK